LFAPSRQIGHAAIDFDDQLATQTDEVGAIGSERMFAPE
jgi:hypothetical protein